MIQLSAQDATFLALDRPYSPWNGGLVFVYDRSTSSGGMDFQDVCRHFEDRLHLIDIFRLKLKRVPGNLGRPYWVEDESLDLEYHMRNIALPPPGDWQQFCLQVSRLIARPLDLSRPPWELYMIEGLNSIDRFSKDSFALVLKVHHAALDGRAFLAILGVLHSLKRNAELPPPSEREEIEPEPSSVDLLLRAGKEASRAPFETARILRKALPGLSGVALPALTGGKADDDEKPGSATPVTRFNAPISPHRSWGACFFPLEDTKAIRKAVEGATVNDIAVSVFGGAIRTYLGEVGELPQDPLKLGIVIDVRSEEDRQNLGNQISGMFANMATDIEDPLERLKAVTASTHSGKKTTSKIGPRDMVGLLELTPEALLTAAAPKLWDAGNREGRGLFSKFNTAVTGMAGPPKPLYLGGAKLTHLIGFGPVADGLGLINIQHSYDGELTLTFTADRKAMPDPGRYEECIYQSFNDLLQAARPKKKAPARKKSPSSKSTPARKKTRPKTRRKK
jgi:diacylglycerol O-acyltransferase / wax synthase